MIIDLAATVGFKDLSGMRNFFLVHRFVHDAEAQALTQRYAVPASSFGISDQSAEEVWLNLMQQGKPRQPMPKSLTNWLRNHADIHIANYTLLGQTPTAAPDLSQVDFGSQEEFYDWMYAHQQMHDFEQSSLGLT